MLFNLELFEYELFGIKLFEKKFCQKGGVFMEPLFPLLRRFNILTARYCGRANAIKEQESVTGIHGWLIHFLYTHQDEPIYQRDIEKKFSIRRSTVTAMLNRMEKNQLIIRLPVIEDARLKRIVLTEKAVALHHEVEQECKLFETVLTEGISPEEQEQFQHVLKIMCQNLETLENEGGHHSC
jgi:DNA-binding MarR family transcriptional regulator